MFILSRGSVAHCFKLLDNVRYRTSPTRDQRFESSGSRSVFNIFCLLGSHVLVLFFIWKYSLFYELTSFE